METCSLLVGVRAQELRWRHKSQLGVSGDLKNYPDTKITECPSFFTYLLASYSQLYSSTCHRYALTASVLRYIDLGSLSKDYYIYASQMLAW